MRTIKTYRKVGAFYIAWEADFPTPIDSKLRDGLNIRYFPQMNFWAGITSGLTVIRPRGVHTLHERRWMNVEICLGQAESRPREHQSTGCNS